MPTPSGDEWEEFQRWKAAQDPTTAPFDVDKPMPSVAAAAPSYAASPSVPAHRGSPDARTTTPVEVAKRSTRHTSRNAIVAAITVLVLAAVGIAIYNLPSSAETRLVAGVERQIEGIGTVTLARLAAVDAAAAAYERLGPELQAQVSNSQSLEAAVAKVANLVGEVEATQSAIDLAISNGDCESAIAAKAHYEELDPTQRARTDKVSHVLFAVAGCEAAEQAEEAEVEEAARAAEEKRKRNLIRVSGEWWSQANSDPDEGCDYFVTPKFKNLSKKTLNYVWFDVSFTNKVGDIAPGVDGETAHSLRLVGPIKPGKSYDDKEYGFTLNYGCGEPEGLLINNVKIEYKDGTQETFDWEYLRCAKSWHKTCEG